MDTTTTTSPPPPPPPPAPATEPVMVAGQQAYTVHTSHGSVGPVIGVVAVIAVVGIIAGMIGRLCSGRTIMGYGGDFDVEGWVETKCSSCLDGHVGPSPPLPPPHTVAPAVERWNGTAAVRAAVGGTGEIKTEEEEQQQQQQREEEEDDKYHQNHQERHSHVDES